MTKKVLFNHRKDHALRFNDFSISSASNFFQPDHASLIFSAADSKRTSISFIEWYYFRTSNLDFKGYS